MGQVERGVSEQGQEQLKDVEQQGREVEQEREEIEDFQRLGNEANGTMKYFPGPQDGNGSGHRMPHQLPPVTFGDRVMLYCPRCLAMQYFRIGVAFMLGSRLLLMLVTLPCAAAFGQGQSSKHYLYARVDPPVIWNDGQSAFTVQVVTTKTGVASVTFFGDAGRLPMYDDGTHGDDVAGDGTYTRDNLTKAPVQLAFGGTFVRTGVEGQIVYTDGSAENFEVDIGVAALAQTFDARKLGPGLYATGYALFVVDPSFGPLSGFSSGESGFDSSNKFLHRAAQALYSAFPDQFDFIVAMPGRTLLNPNTSPPYREGSPFFIRVGNQVQNIGIGRLDNSKDWGSSGRLKGIVYHSFGEGAILTHEFGHSWSAFVGSSLGLEGCDLCYGGHWNPYTDIGGVMSAYVGDSRLLYGAGWLSYNNDGTWHLYRDPNNVNGVYSKLDLYLMGLIPSSEVPAVHKLINPDFTDITRVTADKVESYTVQQITNAERVPSWQDSPKTFTAAFVIVNDRDFSPAEFTFYSSVVRNYTSIQRPPIGFQESFVTPFYDATGRLATMTARLPQSPELSIAKTHGGNFTQGQAGATYTVTVSNGVSAGDTSGTVTVTETVPSGLTLASMSGPGWSCATLHTCTRGDALTGGSSYPAIIVTVSVDQNAKSTLSNQVAVSGGGSASATATDATVITANPPVLPIVASVVNGASFQPGIVPNSWITIQGSNLAPATDTWDKSIVNGNLPTTLDGVTVSIGGKPAYLYYISPGQINAVAPDVGAGSVAVTVKNPSGTSAPAAATSQIVGPPAFFLWAGKYAVATRQDYSLAVKDGTFQGVTTTPAKPGDVIILWGTGFGPTTPVAPFGVQIPADKTYLTANPVSVKVGGLQAQVYGAALAPGFAGLYQVAIQIPPAAPDGDLTVIATVGNTQSPGSVLITVQH